MNMLGALILVALFLLAVFILANWTTLSAPTTLSFVVFEAEGPPGMVLVGVILALMALFFLYVLTLRANMLLETRRHNQELQAQRKLAESAEHSRVRELEARIGLEFAQVRNGLDGMGGRLDELARSMGASLTENTNGLAALVGEMDDKLDRVLQRDRP